MRVEVKLLLTFKKMGPDGEKPFGLDLPFGTTVGQALESVSIPPSKAKVIILNGRVSQESEELKDGDRITVFPPIEGG